MAVCWPGALLAKLTAVPLVAPMQGLSSETTGIKQKWGRNGIPPARRQLGDWGPTYRSRRSATVTSAAAAVAHTLDPGRGFAMGLILLIIVILLLVGERGGARLRSHIS